jgi:NADP-dependent 3-hydroxy acid dehydrogenase YdfG
LPLRIKPGMLLTVFLSVPTAALQGEHDDIHTLFITGATSGFGEACARRFAEAGWKLVLTGRRAERLNALVEELSKQTEVHGLVVDVRDRKGMEEAIANLPPSFATCAA